MAMVLSRVFMLKRQGIKAMQFGEMDKRDFLIPPFALLFVYLIFAHAFNLPKFGSLLFESGFVSWIGVAVCIVGLIIFLMSLIAFGKSFRVYPDRNTSDLPELDISDLPCSWVLAVLPSGTA